MNAPPHIVEAANAEQARPLSRLRQEQGKRKFAKINRKYERDVEKVKAIVRAQGRP